MNQNVLPSFSPLAKSIKIGSVWEHYKGLQYKILAIARHHENFEELIVYQAMYANGDVWVRPLVMFLEHLEMNGQLQPRFRLLSFQN